MNYNLISRMNNCSIIKANMSMQTAYRHAIETGYRFYSYGDACFLIPDHD